MTRPSGARQRQPIAPDPVSARELQLFIENDGTLYRQMHTQQIANLCKRIANGTYDHERAVDLFVYLTDAGAKRYVQAFCLPGQASPWTMFPVPTRRLCAEGLRDAFESEYRCNQHDGINPVPAEERRPLQERAA